MMVTTDGKTTRDMMRLLDSLNGDFQASRSTTVSARKEAMPRDDVEALGESLSDEIILPNLSL